MSSYQEYLRSEHWQSMRRWALERAEHRCQVCNSEGPLDVHHRTYERVGHERPADLVVLCRKCHELFHEDEHEKTVIMTAGALSLLVETVARKHGVPDPGGVAKFVVGRIWAKQA